MSTYDRVKEIDTHGEMALKLYEAGNDDGAQAALGEVAYVLQRMSFEPWTSYGGGTPDPPDPPQGVQWVVRPIPGGMAATLTDWKPNEDDLQRRLPLDGGPFSKISVFVDFVPAPGWNEPPPPGGWTPENPRPSYSAGQITRGPLDQGGFDWRHDLVGACAIKAGKKARFTASTGSETDGDTLALGAAFHAEYAWSPGALTFRTAAEAGHTRSLDDHGETPVFVIGNGAKGNPPEDKWSLGWTYNVRVEAMED